MSSNTGFPMAQMLPGVKILQAVKQISVPYEVTCGKCGIGLTIPFTVTVGDGGQHMVAVKKVFQGFGWSDGSGKYQCPSCKDDQKCEIIEGGQSDEPV